MHLPSLNNSDSIIVLSQEQLDKIQELSSNFMTYKEIAILLKLNVPQFIDIIRNIDSEAHKYYAHGKLITTLEIRAEIVDMAKRGSPAAQVEALKLLNAMEINEILD